MTKFKRQGEANREIPLTAEICSQNDEIYMEGRRGRKGVLALAIRRGGGRAKNQGLNTAAGGSTIIRKGVEKTVVRGEH